jgi:hypothetical protein
VKRLELIQVRICQRCGRGKAQLSASDGATLSVPLDPVRARALANRGDDLRPLAEVVLEHLTAAGNAITEVVLDVADNALRSLVSFADGDVVACPAQDGVELAVRGELTLYATDEALAHANGRAGATDPETVH